MNKFRITYTRPYLPIPERHELQYDVLLAESEQQVRDIFADCEILRVELLKQDYEQDLESQKNAALIWAQCQEPADEEMDAVHNYIYAAEAGDLAALQYGDFDLGTRAMISGGEVMELDAHLEARYDEKTEEDMPF